MRQCGECKACCVSFRVPELEKPENVPCKHLCEIGCGIHATRPQVCRGYECLWLQGALGEGMRPDKSGLILSLAEAGNELERTTGIALIVAMEVTPGSSQSELAKALIEKLSRVRLVVLKIGDKRTLYGPADLVELAYPLLERLTISRE